MNLFGKKNCALIGIVILLFLLTVAIKIGNKIYNAFEVVDNGLQRSQKVVDMSSDSLQSILIKHPDYQGVVQHIASTSDRFDIFMDSVVHELATVSGGWDISDERKRLKNPRDRDITTTLLVQQKGGEHIYKMMERTSEIYNRIALEHLQVDSLEIVLVPDNVHIEKDMSWSAYHFNQMPVAAVMPMFSKWKKDNATTENLLYKVIAQKIERRTTE